MNQAAKPLGYKIGIYRFYSAFTIGYGSLIFMPFIQEQASRSYGALTVGAAWGNVKAVKPKEMMKAERAWYGKKGGPKTGVL